MPKQLRGFAAMSEQKRKAIAARGGFKAHANGRAYKWNSEQAKIAGRKGLNARLFKKERGDL